MERNLEHKQEITDSDNFAAEITIEADQKCCKIKSKARDFATLGQVDHASAMAFDGFLQTHKRLKEAGFVVAPL
jgi:hypothetical protein